MIIGMIKGHPTEHRMASFDIAPLVGSHLRESLERRSKSLAKPARHFPKPSECLRIKHFVILSGFCCVPKGPLEGDVGVPRLIGEKHPPSWKYQRCSAAKRCRIDAAVTDARR
jgi:hypothetical protein